MSAKPEPHPLAGFSTHTQANFVFPDDLTFGQRSMWIKRAADATTASSDLWRESTAEVKPHSVDLVAISAADWVAQQSARRTGDGTADAGSDEPDADPALTNFDAAAFYARLHSTVATRRARDMERLKASVAAMRLSAPGDAAEQTAEPGAPAAGDSAAALSAAEALAGAASLPAPEESATGLQLGHYLLHARSTTSTMTLMTNALASLPAGTVFVADQQRAGRGRGANLWVSPPGCLMCNVSFRVRVGAQLPFVQYLVGWALITAVRRHPLGARLNLRLKWPNDIYMNGRKVGGVLCQSSMDTPATGGAAFGAPTFTAHAGFGINVEAHPEYPSLNTELTQLIAAGPKGRISTEMPALAAAPKPAAAAGALLSGAGTVSAPADDSVDYSSVQPFSRAELLADVISTLDDALPVFNAHGFVPFLADYLGMWLHSGQLVTVEGKEGTFKVTGLSESGYLRAQSVTRPSESFELHPDGNSFDMKQSFIAVKRL
jgi:biotin--protein ligase